MAQTFRGIRLSDETWKALRAARAGRTMEATLAALLAPPSFSKALDTVSVVCDSGGIEQVLALAHEPALAELSRGEIRDVGQQLVALSRRWPH